MGTIFPLDMEGCVGHHTFNTIFASIEEALAYTQGCSKN
jgi:hypothetical protein